jgi:hypothetical protein
MIMAKAVAGVEPYASRLKAHPDEVITIHEPSEIDIVVAGGETQGAWKMIGSALRGNDLQRRVAVTDFASVSVANRPSSIVHSER